MHVFCCVLLCLVVVLLALWGRLCVCVCVESLFLRKSPLQTVLYMRECRRPQAPSELRPTKTSDGKCEDVPAEYTQISSEPRNPDELVCGVLLFLV